LIGFTRIVEGASFLVARSISTSSMIDSAISNITGCVMPVLYHHPSGIHQVPLVWYFTVRYSSSHNTWEENTLPGDRYLGQSNQKLPYRMESERMRATINARNSSLIKSTRPLMHSTNFSSQPIHIRCHRKPIRLK